MRPVQMITAMLWQRASGPHYTHLPAVIQHEHLTMFERRHGSSIGVEIRICGFYTGLPSVRRPDQDHGTGQNLCNSQAAAAGPNVQTVQMPRIDDGYPHRS